MVSWKKAFVCSVVTVTTLIPNVWLIGTAASAVPAVPKCSYSQLEVGTTWGTGDLAGKYGVPFLIVNIGHSSCYLDGYAKLNFTVPTKHHITFDRGPSGAYAYVRPQRVVIEPGRVATFGLTIGEAANQSNHNIAACTVSDVYTDLPVSGFQENYENDMGFNICFADYQVGITSIEPGPLPKAE